MSPSPRLPSAKKPKVIRGFELPSIRTLNTFSYEMLRQQFLPRDLLVIATELLLRETNLDSDVSQSSFGATKDKEGYLQFRFEFPSEQYEIVTRYATARIPDRSTPVVVLEENGPQYNLLAHCDCQTGRKQDLCYHLPAALLALWCMINRDFRVYWNFNLHEASLDSILGRPPRHDPDKDIELSAIYFSPPNINDIALPNSAVILPHPLTSKRPPLKKHSKVDNDPRQNFGIPHPYSRTKYPMPNLLLSSEYYERHYHREEAISQFPLTLRYQFNNGEALFLSELVLHPWFKKVPRSLLPLSNYADAQSKMIPSWAQLHESQSSSWFEDELRTAGRAVLEMLDRHLDSKQSPKVPVYLVKTPKTGEIKKGVPINKVTWEANAPLWALELGPEHNEGHFKFLGLPKASWKIKDDTFKLIPDKVAQTLANNEMTPIQGQSQLAKQVQWLNACLQTRQLPELKKPDTQPVSKEDLLPEIWLDDQEEIRLAWHVPSHKVRIWNTNAQMNKWISILRAGVGAASIFENKEIAISRRGPQRNAELKLLRHAGFAACLFNETLSYALRQSTSTGEALTSDKKFNEWMQSRLGILATNILSTSEQSEKLNLNKIVSKKVNALVNNIINQILDGTLPDRIKKNKKQTASKSVQKNPKLSTALEYQLNPWSSDLGELDDLFDGNFEFEDLLERDETSTDNIVYLRDQILKISEPMADFAQLTLTLLECAASTSGGMCFLKSRQPTVFAPGTEDRIRIDSCSQFVQDSLPQADTNKLKLESSHIKLVEPMDSIATFEHPTQFHPVRAFPSSNDSPNALEACLTLIARGFSVYLNERKIDLFKPDELKTIFDLRSTSVSQEEKSSSNSLDWFELDPVVFLMGRKITREELGKISHQGIVEHRGQLFVIPPSSLPSIRRLSSFWDRLQTGKKVGSSSYDDVETYRKLPRSETLEFLILCHQIGAEVVGGDTRWRQVHEFYLSLDEPRALPTLPSSIHAELKPYQKAGVQWLLDLHQLRLGGILADEMGLGKTVQALSFLEILRHQKKLGPSLIVVPTSLTWNWANESKRFTPKLDMQLFDPKRKHEYEIGVQDSFPLVLIVTYGLLTEHAEWFLGTPEHPKNWHIALFDEAQSLKNIRSLRADAARGLTAQNKFCITGTPLENHVGELYSLLDVVVPGCLGDYSKFKSRFDQLGSTPEASAEIAYLKKKIRPLLLRRQKSQILLELPPKTETKVDLTLETKQRKIYRDIAASWSQQVTESVHEVGEGRSKLLMLTALLRLRQTCSDPACLPNTRYTKVPPKFELLGQSLSEIIESGHSVLVFTQFLGTLDRLDTYLKSLGFLTLSIHGGIPRKKREQVLQEFQNTQKGPQVLIMTLKTGGVGLNLTQASYVFHMEPWWNPAVENQATDRAHRMGQTNAVQVYRYVMKDTIEEKIEVLKSQKSALFESVVNSSTHDHEVIPGLTARLPGPKTELSGSSALSQKDFQELLQP